MQDHIDAFPQAPRREPWNKGKLVGAKPPLRPKHVWSIRTKLQIAGRTRDLAMFNLVRCFQNNAPMSSGCIVDFVTPGVDDGLAIDVGNVGRQAFVEFVFGADADVAQDRTRQL